MFVQIGAFSQPENAERLVARLRASGFANPDRRQRARRPAQAAPRAVGADCATRVEFDQLNARLRAIGVSGSRLVVDARAMIGVVQWVRARRVLALALARRGAALSVRRSAAVLLAPPKVGFKSHYLVDFTTDRVLVGERAPTSSFRRRA